MRIFFWLRCFCGSLVCSLLFACTPPELSEKNAAAGINLDLQNPLVRKLYDFRDERKVDSLLNYLDDADPTLRYLAALSFASIPDSGAISQVAGLLGDEVEDVRIAAAFALGQIGKAACEKPLIDAFMADDPMSEHQRFNAIVLEAVGKCGSLASLRNIATVTTYKPADTLLLEGQCRAVYRYGLRDSILPVATQLMISYVANERIPVPARLMAAHYLARSKNVRPDSAQAKEIAAGFVRARNSPEVRMALATALGKSQTEPAFAMLSKVIASEQDWRVKCNIINALSIFEYDTVRALVTPFITHKNQHISLAAAEFFIRNGQVKDGDYYWRITRDHPDMPMATQIALFRASNKLLSVRNQPESKFYVIDRIKALYQQAGNPYDRAACLHALAEFGWNYRWIHDKGYTDPHPAVKTAATEALKSIAELSNFYSIFGENARTVRRDLYYYFREAIAGGDVGMIVASSEGLQAEALNYKSYRDTARIGILKESLAKLKLPRDVEAYMALDKTLAFFEERPAPLKPVIPNNHPIDWEEMKKFSARSTVTIATGKGPIVLELYPLWAPGSVANLLRLANSGFFNGKNFHRVVSNHVIQGGCPRGDGYGALDYSIRTEIGLVWFDGAGYLGMASAGPDTEGTQFFITHSARPHLDGKFTIFGKVRSGMEVVDQIQPGDQITGVTVQY
ncbi:MAG: peptidylprolyl isomerase [Lewinellaceae bacterium]|nr:peptidylprolyl isomerase [Lewinellaceae bacterium]